jgi:hypothetical protein
VSPRRSTADHSEKQNAKSIVVMNIGDDDSTNTSGTNNNSTPIVELLRKGKTKAYTKPTGASKGLYATSEKKPASVPPARASSRSKSTPTSSTNRARGSSRSKSTTTSSTNKAGGTNENSKTKGTSSRSKSNSPQKKHTRSSDRAARTSVPETPPPQKKPLRVSVRLGEKEATPIKVSGLSTSEESQSRDS